MNFLGNSCRYAACLVRVTIRLAMLTNKYLNFSWYKISFKKSTVMCIYNIAYKNVSCFKKSSLRIKTEFLVDFSLFLFRDIKKITLLAVSPQIDALQCEFASIFVAEILRVFVFYTLQLLQMFYVLQRRCASSFHPVSELFTFVQTVL